MILLVSSYSPGIAGGMLFGPALQATAPKAGGDPSPAAEVLRPRYTCCEAISN
jgi:hypothetical protein